ncbi:hypothetical protein HEO51_021535 [Escherichia coli]|nr:hypothetical protein [Escherichia coli]MBB8803941.1 hypothetical protein [Escherichia coli]HBP8240151.1 hypothetical protein [Escherichia coli]
MYLRGFLIILIRFIIQLTKINWRECIIYNEFVKCRNEIVHENIGKIDTFNYIMTYFKVCNDFLCDIFNEFYSGKAQDLIIENIIHLCLRVTNERSDILENLCKSKKVTT